MMLLFHVCGGSPVWFYQLLITSGKKHLGPVNFFCAPASRTEKDSFSWDTETVGGPKSRTRKLVPTSQKYMNKWNPQLIWILHAIPKRKSSTRSVYLDDFGIKLIKLSIIGSVSIWNHRDPRHQGIRNRNRSGNRRIHENWRSPHLEAWRGFLGGTKQCDVDILCFLVFDTGGATGCSCWPPTALGCYGASGESPGWSSIKSLKCPWESMSFCQASMWKGLIYRISLYPYIMNDFDENSHKRELG